MHTIFGLVWLGSSPSRHEKWSEAYSGRAGAVAPVTGLAETPKAG